MSTDCYLDFYRDRAAIRDNECDDVRVGHAGLLVNSRFGFMDALRDVIYDMREPDPYEDFGRVTPRTLARVGALFFELTTWLDVLRSTLPDASFVAEVWFGAAAADALRRDAPLVASYCDLARDCLSATAVVAEMRRRYGWYVRVRTD